jgi:Uma2 family endonuclease
VKEYSIVDPASKTVEVMKNPESGFTLHTKAKTQCVVTSSLLAGFQVDVTKLFADL